MKIGNNIKLFISKKNYPDAELARRIGRDPAYLTRLCNNEEANPTAKIMFTIAKELGVSIEKIWFVDEACKKSKKMEKK